MTDFFINRVLPLFDTNGKSFVQVQTDSSNGYLLIKKEKDHGKHRFLYKDMLPEDLYEYKLKSDEDEYLRNIFKAHILIRDKFYMLFLNHLCDCYNKKDYNFSLSQLELFIEKDEPFALEIINDINCKDKKFLNLLKRKLSSNLISPQLNEYMKTLLLFYSNKITNFSSPSVLVYNENNIKIDWHR